jgi:hypothetical protein
MPGLMGSRTRESLRVWKWTDLMSPSGDRNQQFLAESVVTLRAWVLFLCYCLMVWISQRDDLIGLVHHVLLCLCRAFLTRWPHRSWPRWSDSHGSETTLGLISCVHGMDVGVRGRVTGWPPSHSLGNKLGPSCSRGCGWGSFLRKAQRPGTIKSFPREHKGKLTFN